MATNIETVRLFISDPDPPPASSDFDTAFFDTDAKIQVFIDTAGGDLWLAASYALTAMATDYAQQAVIKSTAGQITDSQIWPPERLLKLAKHYKELSDTTPYSAEVEAAVYPWTSNASLEVE
jgi:hypothetical protein